MLLATLTLLFSVQEPEVVELPPPPPPERAPATESPFFPPADEPAVEVLDLGNGCRLQGRVLRATDRPVRAVMVPRVDMVTLPEGADVERCMRLVRRYGFSRYPVAQDDDPDRIVGYLYVKDLLMAARLIRILQWCLGQIFL